MIDKTKQLQEVEKMKANPELIAPCFLWRELQNLYGLSKKEL